MPTWTIKGGGKPPGYDISWDTSVSANAYGIVQPTLEAGMAATTWTYSSSSAGTAVMPAGHTIEDDDKVDLYWADGYRYGMTAAVTDDSVALSGGAGDNAPASDTAVVLCVQVPVGIAFVGDNLAAILASATYRSLVCFVDGSSNVLPFEILPTAGLSWHNQSGLDNPFDSFTVVSATISTTDTTSETTETPVFLGILYDSTPTYPG